MRGHEWPSVAMSGHQWPSVAISGHQCQAVAISGHHQWPSEAYLDRGAAREADEEDVERSEQPDDRDHHLVRYAREYPRKEDLRRRGQGMRRRSEHLHASSSSRSTQGCLRSECMQVLSTAGAHREAVGVCDPSALKPSARRSPLGEEHARHGEIPHEKRRRGRVERHAGGLGGA